MRTLGRVLFWFVLGFILTYVAAAAVGVAYMEVMEVSQREGAAAMALMFFFAPACGLIGGVLGAILAAARKPRT